MKQASDKAAIGVSGQPLRVLYPFNVHRGGGGADNAVHATIEVCREGGIEAQIFTRSSEDLPRGIAGRLKAGLSAIYAPESVQAFKTALDVFQPDLVHAHEVFPLVSPWIFPVCSQRGIPLVVTCVDYRLTCPIVTHLRGGEICTECTGGREYRALLNNCRNNLPESATVALYNVMARKLGLFSRHVDEFIISSPFARDWLVEHAGIPPDRISVTSPVVSIPETAADPAMGNYVGFAGRIAPEKGIRTLIEAARCTGLPFRIARHVASRVSVEIPPQIEVVVTHSPQDLAKFYRGARLFVFPSVFFETFGIAAAESMSHGVPIVTSRFGAMSNLIEEGVSGVFFERGNSSDLAEKVKRLWDDSCTLRKLGAAARKRAIDSWSPERHFEVIMEVYGRAMVKKARKVNQS